MKLREFLEDRRTQQLIDKFWVVEFCFADDLNAETPRYNIVKLGQNMDEYSLDATPFSHYYKRFGNLVKIIPNKDKEVKNIQVGCSGRGFCATYNLTCEELNTLDKFFHIVNLGEV